MTKKEFFRYCDASTEPLRIRWGTSCAYFETERSVFLGGLWASGAIVEQKLYTPTPGRQGQDCYQSAIKLCEAAVLKYERWLEDWREKHHQDVKKAYRWAMQQTPR